MATTEELLKAVWEEEVLGEATFSGLAERLPVDATMWRGLTTLEGAPEQWLGDPPPRTTSGATAATSGF